jgi:histidine triad (HIT) family protein
VPRRKKDGLKGFFWPRHPYKDQNELRETQRILQVTIKRLQYERHA